MTSDQKRAHWKKNWNYGMTEQELDDYITKKSEREMKAHPDPAVRSLYGY